MHIVKCHTYSVPLAGLLAPLSSDCFPLEEAFFPPAPGRPLSLFLSAATFLAIACASSGSAADSVGAVNVFSSYRGPLRQRDRHGRRLTRVQILLWRSWRLRDTHSRLRARLPLLQLKSFSHGRRWRYVQRHRLTCDALLSNPLKSLSNTSFQPAKAEAKSHALGVTATLPSDCPTALRDCTNVRTNGANSLTKTSFIAASRSSI